MWNHMSSFGWGGMGFGMLLFWGVVIAAVAVLVKNFWGPRDLNLPDQEKSALDILNERYARGEISREEYEEKKRDIAE
jgi:putative membrane protein